MFFKKNKQKKKWKFFGIIKTIGTIIGSVLSAIFTILFLVVFAGMFISPDSISIPSGNIAIIPITGTIVSAGTAGGFGMELTSSDKLIELIKKANESKAIKGIIFEINSPGGSPVASAEIASAIKEIVKPKFALIKETGASGAYWIATATDKIFANKMSVTGSIGVTASSLEYAGLLTKYNVSYRRLVAGELKDAGSPFRTMTDKERELFQRLLDKIHDYFIEEVSKNRKISIEKVREIATGFVFLGEEAKQIGLIDQIGSRQDAIKVLEKQLNISAEIAEIKPKKGLFDLLSTKFESFSYFAGKGFGSAFTEQRIDNHLKVFT